MPRSTNDTEIPVRKKKVDKPVPQMAPLVLPKRERQERVDLQLEVQGRGKFQLPNSFEWHNIPSSGAFVPPGSAIRMDSRGEGGSVGNLPVGPGELLSRAGLG